MQAGLEATGHYSFAILGYLLEKGFACYVFNPLHTNLYRKAVSLRKTKTDKVDSKTIALMLLSSVGLKPYCWMRYARKVFGTQTSGIYQFMLEYSPDTP